MIDFKIFIASSMALKEYRDAVKLAVDEVNRKNYNCTFSFYDYNDHTPQRQEVNSAQAPVNKIIEECAFFVLIIDGVIKEKTLEEYKEATRLSLEHRYPVYISIFYKKDSVAGVRETGQHTFPEFQEKYINKGRFDENMNLVKDQIIYPYPFENAEQIQNKLTQEIHKWMTSPYRPLLDAKLGKSFTLSDFYKDRTRKEYCVESVYFRRKFDWRLQEEMENPKDIIYLYGVSLSGKTRALYQAVSKKPQGWFYMMPSVPVDTDELINKIHEITQYLKRARLEQKLYLVFDDFDKYELENEVLSNALALLFTQVNKKECTILMTASSPFHELPVASLFESVEMFRIEIPVMKPEEHVEAVQLFRRNGLLIEEQNTKYHTTGALLINLNKRKLEYQTFLNKDNSASQTFRKNFLRSIKAFSIWHNSNLGDLDNLYDFCSYLCRKENWNEDEYIPVVQDLLKCTGITDEAYLSPEKKKRSRLNIQEYVYRYFIGYKGEVMGDEEKSLPEDELALIYLILSYVYRKGRPLLIDFGKIISRCEHRKEVSDHLFGLFQGQVKPLLQNNEWVTGLLQEKEAIESGLALDNFTEEVPLYYPKIFKQKIYNAASFEEARAYYETAKEGLRDMFMIGALLARAREPEQIKEVETLPEYAVYAKESFILYKRIIKKESFEEALAIFREFENPNEQAYIDYMLMEETWSKNTDEKRFRFMFDIDWYQKSLYFLFGSISCEEDLEQVCKLLRRNYIVCTDDKDILACYDEDPETYSKEQLTFLDLLGLPDIFTILKAFKKLYQQEYKPARSMGEFIRERLIKAVPSTLATGWLPRYRIRLVITTVANAFINHFGKKGFGEVYKYLFTQLEDKKNEFIFRDSYTYCSLLEMEECSLWEAQNVFYNFIVPHSQDPHNYLSINHFMLNNLLDKAKKEKGNQIHKINCMFDDFHVERDRYSYNLIMESISFGEGTEIVKSMLEQKIQLDRYTLCSLVKTAPDISVALGLFELDRLELPEGFRVKRLFAGDRKLIELAAKLQLRQTVSSQQYAWLCLFGKTCADEKERTVLTNCMAYLEKDPVLSDLLIDSKLYNVCLKNHSYIRNYTEVKWFLSQHPHFIFDSYSLLHCIEILITENVFDSSLLNRTRIIREVNDLFRYAYGQNVRISNTHYNIRLKLFHSHLPKDGIRFVFFQKDGQAIEETFTPLEYVKCMEKCGIEIDKHTVIALVNIRKFISDSILNEILNICFTHSIPIDKKFKISLLQKYATLIKPATVNKLDQLLMESNPVSYNKQVYYAYSVLGNLSFGEAIRKVDKSSIVSSATTYNALLSSWIKKEKSNKDFDSDKQKCLYEKAWHVYKEYILKYSRPTAHTFSILSGVTNHLGELKELIHEINRLNTEQQYNLPITGYMLTSLIDFASTVNELRNFIQAHENYGGEITLQNTDIVLKKLIQMANKGDVEAEKYVMEIAQFIFRSLPQHPPVFDELPLLVRYINPRNVTELTIKDFLFWKKIEDYFQYEDIIRSFFKSYPHLFEADIEFIKYLARRPASVERFVPVFHLLNASNDNGPVNFRIQLLLGIIGNWECNVWKNPVRYEEYKIIIECCMKGEYTSEQLNKIGFAVIKLVQKLNTNRNADNRFKTILKVLYKQIYLEKLSFNHYLDFQDTMENTVEFILIDNGKDTLFLFNQILLYRLADIWITTNFNRVTKLTDEIKYFLQKHNLHFKTIKEIADRYLHKFTDLNALIPLINNSPEYLLAILTCMAKKLDSDDKLKEILWYTYKYNIDLKEELMSNLARSILDNQHKDPVLKKVYNQIIHGLQTHCLQGYHFVADKSKSDPKFNVPVVLFKDVEEKILLCHLIQTGLHPIEASRLLAAHYQSSLQDAQRRANVKEVITINQAFVSAFICLYVKLSRREEKDTTTEQKGKWIEMLKGLYRFSPTRMVDVSVLIPDQPSLNMLRQMNVKLTVLQQTLDYAILRDLDIPLKEKLTLIVEANALLVWLNSFDKSEDILDMLSEISKLAPDQTKTVIGVAISKAGSLDTFKRMLLLLDQNPIYLKYYKCVESLFSRLLYFLLTSDEVYQALQREKLSIGEPFLFHKLGKLFKGLELKSKFIIQAPDSVLPFLRQI